MFCHDHFPLGKGIAATFRRTLYSIGKSREQVGSLVFLGESRHPGGENGGVVSWKRTGPKVDAHSKTRRSSRGGKSTEFRKEAGCDRAAVA